MNDLKAEKTLFCKNCKHIRAMQKEDKYSCVIDPKEIIKVNLFDHCKYYKVINT